METPSSPKASPPTESSKAKRQRQSEAHPAERIKNFDEVDEIIKRFPAMECKNYLDYCGCFHSAAAFGIASAFDDHHDEDIIYFHLNRNLFGRIFIVGVKVYVNGERSGCEN